MGRGGQGAIASQPAPCGCPHPHPRSRRRLTARTCVSTSRKSASPSSAKIVLTGLPAACVRRWAWWRGWGVGQGGAHVARRALGSCLLLCTASPSCLTPPPPHTHNPPAQSGCLYQRSSISAPWPTACRPWTCRWGGGGGGGGGGRAAWGGGGQVGCTESRWSARPPSPPSHLAHHPSPPARAPPRSPRTCPSYPPGKWWCPAGPRPQTPQSSASGGR